MIRLRKVATIAAGVVENWVMTAAMLLMVEDADCDSDDDSCDWEQSVASLFS
jgi:hypothetical protein